jgi:hypothetical protein
MNHQKNKTTLVIERDLHHQFKIHCASKGIMMKTMISQLIEKELKNNQEKK